MEPNAICEQIEWNLEQGNHGEASHLSRVLKAFLGGKRLDLDWNSYPKAKAFVMGKKASRGSRNKKGQK